MIDRKQTTAEAAKRAGIHQVTLQKWIAAGRVKAPKPVLIGAVGYRLWSANDIASLLNVKREGQHPQRTGPGDAGVGTGRVLPAPWLVHHGHLYRRGSFGLEGVAT